MAVVVAVVVVAVAVAVAVAAAVVVIVVVGRECKEEEEGGVVLMDIETKKWFVCFVLFIFCKGKMKGFRLLFSFLLFLYHCIRVVYILFFKVSGS